MFFRIRRRTPAAAPNSAPTPPSRLRGVFIVAGFRLVRVVRRGVRRGGEVFFQLRDRGVLRGASAFRRRRARLARVPPPRARPPPRVAPRRDPRRAFGFGPWRPRTARLPRHRSPPPPPPRPTPVAVLGVHEREKRSDPRLHGRERLGGWSRRREALIAASKFGRSVSSARYSRMREMQPRRAPPPIPHPPRRLELRHHRFLHREALARSPRLRRIRSYLRRELQKIRTRGPRESSPRARPPDVREGVASLDANVGTRRAPPPRVARAPSASDDAASASASDARAPRCAPPRGRTLGIARRRGSSRLGGVGFRSRAARRALRRRLRGRRARFRVREAFARDGFHLIVEGGAEGGEFSGGGGVGRGGFVRRGELGARGFEPAGGASRRRRSRRRRTRRRRRRRRGRGRDQGPRRGR